MFTKVANKLNISTSSSNARCSCRTALTMTSNARSTTDCLSKTTRSKVDCSISAKNTKTEINKTVQEQTNLIRIALHPSQLLRTCGRVFGDAASSATTTRNARRVTPTSIEFNCRYENKHFFNDRIENFKNKKKILFFFFVRSISLHLPKQ